MRRLRSCYSALGVVIAASGAADCKLISISFVALVDCLAKTTCVHRRSRDRERQWEKRSNQRENQQKSGGQALHGFVILSQNPTWGSIEHIRERVQTEAGEGARPTSSGIEMRVALHLRFPLDLGPPPTNADEEEAPIAEEFRGLAFKGVADELEDPSDHEERQGVEPQAMEEKAGGEYRDRNQNRGNTEGVANTIYGMLVAARVLRDPLLAVAVA
jgi:hypothetical protein